MKENNNLYLLFENAVRLHPNDYCIAFQNIHLTYKQLEQKVSEVHHALLANAKDEYIIGLSTTRGIDQIVFMLAILKSGKAYLPIDFGYPKNRIQNIIKNSNLTFCLSNKADEEHVVSMGLTLLNNNLKTSTDSGCKQDEIAQNAAYILYTSGSTGEPKGVCMGQDAVINLINWQNKNSTSKNGTRTLQFAPLSFDVSFQEIMTTLSTGGTLVLIDEYLRLDMIALINYIKEQQVNRLFLPFVALQALADAALSTDIFPSSLKEIMTAGEQLKITPEVNAFFSKLDNCVLYNQYGPTECHVVTELKLDGNPANWTTLPSIGKPIDNTSILILNQNQEILKNGEIGELYIAGECLAEGYLNNKELTNEKFLEWKSPEGKNIRIYKSGDIAKYLEDGNIEFLGRQDDQVKISGHRIELAEVELAINSLDSIQQTVVLASNHLGQTQLVAYIQSNQEIDVNDIREKTSNLLPDYMMPSYFILIKDFPKTSSGKIDKKSLPAPEYSRPSNAPLYKKATTVIQKNITQVWTNLLHIPKIGIDDNFFELGGTSLLAQKVVAFLLKDYKYKLPVTKLYQFPSIYEIANYLEADKKIDPNTYARKNNNANPSTNVAIIGMAGRFPGAKSINELWEVLKEGKETISFFKPEEIDSSIPEALRNDPLYVGARGIIPSANTFDAAFFGINPKLAEAMDPQQRLFLEIAWEALEQTGYLPKHYKGNIGIYAGTGTNSYYKKNILTNTAVLDQVGYFQAETVNEKDYVATRTAYQLNLKGPAVSVHSACSTSLLAIAEAVEAIRNGRCDVALAGGSSITAPIFSGHLYQEGSMLSSDGHCRSFDASAKGTVFSDGAGVVLLKNLDQAQKDGDKIYGIIKGIGVTNDGGNKGSFTAPSTEGQAEAIMKAIQDAQITPDTISYIETHGTATPLGDPIEIEGLKMAFGEQPKNGYCAIGSIKSNMGHLTAAAGVAGLIKTILAINNKLIPASLGFENPNPVIDFENSPFFVNSKLRSWESDQPLRAGISSFGVGGTNVHLVVEEYPAEQKISGSGRPLELLMWSAKSENSLKGYEIELGNFLESTPDLPLADVAFSLNKTRDSFIHRSFLLAKNSVDASQELLSIDKYKTKSAILKTAPSELAFLFPGQGSQFSQMGMNLYKNEMVYKEAVDTCADFLLSELQLDIREILYPETVTPETEAKLKNTRYTQPALFVTEYALAQLWLSWGIKPTVFCGHSIGEFIAAHLAGVFSLEDALHLIAVRGRLVSELPNGSMLSVRLSEDELKAILPETLSIAAINSSVLCVVAGETEKTNEFAKTLDEKEIANKLLFTSHAFHSNMMDPILETFESEAKKIQLNKPNLPIVSTVTGTWLKDEEAIDTKYWTNHLRNTVRFADAADTLLKLEDIIFLEVGPGQTLTTLTKQQGVGKSTAAFSSLTLPKNQENEYHSLLNALGELWLKGIEPDWNNFYKNQERQKINLPSYVFDRKLCWIDPPMTTIQNSTPNTIRTQDSISNPIKNKPMRKTTILTEISSIVSQTSGIDYPTNASSQSFLDLGLDSLTLTQLATKLKKDFKLPITFRQLNEEFSSPSLLADYLDQNLPKEEFNPPAPAPRVSDTITAPVPLTNTNFSVSNSQNNTALGLIAQQLQLLGKQMELLQGNPIVSSNEVPQQVYQEPEPIVFTKKTNEDVRTAEEIAEHQKPFGASPKIEKKANSMSQSQKDFLDELIVRYTTKTGASKSYAQKNRSTMADPRVVTGFKPLTKEIVYPIVIEKSSGNRLWDIDGNVYIDALNGFGSSMFGHQPDFIKEALHQQVENGFEVGPQHPFAGEVCELLCEFTKHDRAALCNTGSEAVLGAMRIARTVTGRSLIVAFSGSYHGIVDEVLVRGSKKLVTFPAAPGIMPESVQNMLILEYGTDESLRIITERADEIAAVLVEPVQSRRPEFQPVAFLKNLRNLTTQSDIALIFDEVITGFRMHPGGAQALFEIKADIATYGKVIGGGLSIGAITGNRKYLDALDGGQWQFGDDSIPEIGVTYFAGTFVRHPLALAASKASLLHLKKQGPALQEKLNNMTSRLASELNAEFKKKDLPMIINHFGSLWRLKFNDDVLYGELLFTLLRENGIHIWDGFPCFMTEAYTEEDLIQLINTFKNCLNKMVASGFFITNKSNISTPKESSVNSPVISNNNPPVEGAKLGRDRNGNPAWFIADSTKKGEYVKIDL